MFFKSYDLSFERGSILTKEMLGELYGSPKEHIHILYSSYDDGILDGLHIKKDQEGNVWIGEGVVKYSGRIYRMRQAFCLSEYITEMVEKGELTGNMRCQLVIEPYEEKENKDIAQRSSITKYSMRFRILGRSKKTEGIVFAYFKLNSEKNFFIKDDIEMKELLAEEDFNMLPCPYSVKNSVTYHPYIFQVIEKSILIKKKKTNLDYLLLSQIMHYQVIDYNFIILLLGDYGKNVDMHNKEEVLDNFIQIIQEQEQQKSNDMGIESNMEKAHQSKTMSKLMP